MMGGWGGQRCNAAAAVVDWSSSSEQQQQQRLKWIIIAAKKKKKKLELTWLLVVTDDWSWRAAWRLEAAIISRAIMPADR